MSDAGGFALLAGSSCPRRERGVWGGGNHISFSVEDVQGAVAASRQVTSATRMGNLSVPNSGW